MAISSSKRSFLSTILLVLTAVVAGVYVFWVARDDVTSTERAERARSAFPVFRREALTRVELSHGDEKLVLERDLSIHEGLAWRMVAPVRAKVDAVMVEKLLAAIEFANIIRPITDASPKLFEAPRVRGAISMEKLRTTFDLGPDAPTPDGAAYFRVDGAVMVVARDLVAQLLVPANRYSERDDRTTRDR